MPFLTKRSLPPIGEEENTVPVHFQLCYFLNDLLDSGTWKCPSAIGRPELGEKPFCLTGHHRVTDQKVGSSRALARTLLRDSGNLIFGHSSLSLFLRGFLQCFPTFSFRRLFFLGRSSRGLAVRADTRAMGSFDNSHPIILNEYLLVPTWGASFRGISGRSVSD